MYTGINLSEVGSFGARLREIKIEYDSASSSNSSAVFIELDTFFKCIAKAEMALCTWSTSMCVEADEMGDLVGTLAAAADFVAVFGAALVVDSVGFLAGARGIVVTMID
jgi:hypothetical protein